MPAPDPCLPYTVLYNCEHFTNYFEYCLWTSLSIAAMILSGEEQGWINGFILQTNVAHHTKNETLDSF
jgi:hypothetical protein